MVYRLYGLRKWESLDVKRVFSSPEPADFLRYDNRRKKFSFSPRRDLIIKGSVWLTTLPQAAEYQIEIFKGTPRGGELHP